MGGAALVLLTIPSVFAQDDSPTVLVAQIRGAITPVIAEHMRDAVERAERERSRALLVTIDTPGGLDTSMREVVQSFLNSRVPVIAWVTPKGAQAASAGAVITLSAHVAAMSPGTNIGAATPVTIEGAEVGDKIVNNAAAYIAAIAEERGRNIEVARDMVHKGRSEPASRAVRLGVVDLLADDGGMLLRATDGRDVDLPSGAARLGTTGARLVEFEMGFLSRVRQRLADPNLAYLFLSIGTLAIVFELVNPGVGLSGITGVVLIVLGMFGLSVLPVNAAGVVLLLLAAGLFIAELFVPGIGVLAVGGGVSLALAGLFLVRGSLGVDLAVILPTAITIKIAVFVAGRIAWRARKARPATGPGVLEGRTATVRRADGGKGSVFIDGAWWKVRSEEPLEVGADVRVKTVDGLELVVESAKGESSD